MVIRRLAIRNFGKINNASLELTPGLNVIYGENESGKTTVHTFMKSMLYGISRSRGRGARTDIYSKYEPWENPADYGGTIWLEKDEKMYRLNRSFARERMSEELYCETDSELLDIEEGALDDLLGGVSETVYENTVSIAQLKSVTGKELIQELQNYMISYQGTGDASVDLGRAVQMLKMTRKGFLVQEERRQKKREIEREKLDANYDYVQQELEALKQRKKTMERKNEQGRTASKNDRKNLEKRLAKLDDTQRFVWMGMFFTVAFALLLAVLFPMISEALFWLGMVVLAAGGIGVVVEMLWIKALGKEKNRIKKALRAMKKREEKLDWNEESIVAAIAEKETNLENLRTEIEEFEAEKRAVSPAQVEVEALNLAMETMEGLTDQFHSRIGIRLRMRTSEILSEITEGKYKKVLLDPDFRIQVEAEERIVPVESLSRGTVEQIYFALRMAAGELLCGKETFPVILDDVFGMYDEERLTAVLKWLEKEPRQVIISTCHKRELEILRKEEIPFHEVNFYV